MGFFFVGKTRPCAYHFTNNFSFQQQVSILTASREKKSGSTERAALVCRMDSGAISPSLPSRERTNNKLFKDRGKDKDTVSKVPYKPVTRWSFHTYFMLKFSTDFQSCLLRNTYWNVNDKMANYSFSITHVYFTVFYHHFLIMTYNNIFKITFH